MKRCGRCGESKPLDDFYRMKSKPDGRQNYCKACHREKNAKWREENAEHVLEYARRFHKEHRDRSLENARKWKQRSLKHRKRYAEEYQTSHPERVRAKRVVNNALRYGHIKRGSVCEMCGSKNRIEGHHDDYSKPLDVRWLCRDCHSLIHRKESGESVYGGIHA